MLVEWMRRSKRKSGKNCKHDSVRRYQMDNEFMEQMLDKALGVLQQCKMDDHSFCPVMIFHEDDIGTIIPIICKSEEERRKKFRELGRHLGFNGIHECMVIDDTYFVMADTKNPSNVERMQYIKENWDTEKPSMYPKELRREALVLMVMNFKDMMKETVWMAEYATSGPNIILSSIAKNFDPKVAGGIKDLILEGFLIGLASKFDAISPEEFSSHINAEYPALSDYIKNHFHH
jgi:hypothetical protein